MTAKRITRPIPNTRSVLPAERSSRILFSTKACQEQKKSIIPVRNYQSGTRKLTKSERAPPRFQNWHRFSCLIKNFNEAEHSKNVFCMCLWPRLKFSKRRSKINGSRPWNKIKGHARSNKHLKYESSSSYLSKVMTKVKVLEKKGQTPRSKVKVLNERSCQKEYTCEIWKPYHLSIKSYDQD
jgi:hypothetical protein